MSAKYTRLGQLEGKFREGTVVLNLELSYFECVTIITTLKQLDHVCTPCANGYMLNVVCAYFEHTSINHSSIVSN